MIGEQKYSNYRLGARTLTEMLVACFCLFLQSGCAVGYIAFNHDAGEKKQALPPLSAVKISYSYEGPTYGDKYANIYSAVFTDVLQKQYLLSDVLWHDTSSEAPPDRFLIRIKRTEEVPSVSMALGMIHMISFAIIPVAIYENNGVAFTVRSPLGKEKDFHYSYTEWAYSWLPFMLFDPGFLAGPQIGHDNYDPERLRIFEEISIRFLNDAAPFLKDQYDRYSSTVF